MRGRRKLTSFFIYFLMLITLLTFAKLSTKQLTMAKVESVRSIRKNLTEMKRMLVIDNGRNLHRIKFRRLGNTYLVQEDNDRLKARLEASFNRFMSKLDIKEDGSQIKGLLYIDKDTEAFSLGYQKKGEAVLHQIKGRLG